MTRAHAHTLTAGDMRQVTHERQREQQRVIPPTVTRAWHVAQSDSGAGNCEGDKREEIGYIPNFLSDTGQTTFSLYSVLLF